MTVGHINVRTRTVDAELIARSIGPMLAMDRAIEPASGPAELIMAFDLSNRFKDADGRLHITASNISKSCINGYRGNEIPGWEELGLEPTRVYQLLRDPAELAKGAATFNNIQLLSTHKAVDAANPLEHLVAGSTGTDARFEPPYLVNSLVIWRAEDIADVESREKCHLSCAYRYQPDMTPGTYEGKPYDGRMVGIVANHVALVAAGRAGPDVLVADSMEGFMPATRLSPRATFLKGAISAYLRPKLLAGTTLALDAALAGVGSGPGWRTQKASALTAIIGMATPKLAKDATMEDMHDFIDRLDGETVEAQDAWEDDDAEAMDEAEAESENEARREERLKNMKAEDRKVARDARRGARDAKRAADKKARDEEPEAMDAEETEAEEKAKKKEAEDKMPMDARMKAAKDRRAARDAKRAMDAKRARDTETEEERKKREADDKAKDAKAMDAAITKASRDTEARVLARMKAIAKAREDVRPLIGALANDGFDSADEIYKLALDHFKVDTEGADPSAYPALVRMIPKPGERKQPLAMDSSAPGSSALSAMFPGASRVRVL